MFSERFRSTTQQDKVISRLEALREVNCHLNVAKALQEMTRQASISYDDLDDNLDYLNTTYKLVIYLIESIHDAQQLESLAKAARRCRRRLLTEALEMRRRNLTIASSGSSSGSKVPMVLTGSFDVEPGSDSSSEDDTSTSESDDEDDESDSDDSEEESDEEFDEDEECCQDESDHRPKKRVKHD